jgi:hypothetical protein
MRCVVADFGISGLFSFLFKLASETIFRKNILNHIKKKFKEKRKFLRQAK